MNSEILDRTPPHDAEAEQWVVGSVLLNPPCLDDLAGRLRAEHFRDPALRTIYAAAVEMRDKREAIDPALLAKRLGAIQGRPAAERIATVLQAVPVAAHAKHYAARVIETARLREIITAATDMLAGAYEEQKSETLLDECEAALSRLATGQYHQGPVSLKDAMLQAVDRAEAIAERGKHAGLLTGTHGFDERIGGLFPGELFVLAARPRIGKTALATQWALHAARQGRFVAFVSLEMGAAELATRMLCGESGINHRLIRTGRLRDDDASALFRAATAMQDAAMAIHERPGMTAADIRRVCRQHRKDGLSLVVVDYLQRVTPADRRRNRYEQVSETIQSMKTLARELEVPVLCLAQLGRDADKEGRPQLHHLRESGDIEAEADVVALIQRPCPWPGVDGKPEHDPPGDHAGLIVEKNRNGETATLRLYWEAERTRFVCPEAF